MRRKNISDIVLTNATTAFGIENYYKSDGHAHIYENNLRYGKEVGVHDEGLAFGSSFLAMLCQYRGGRLLGESGWWQIAVVTYESRIPALALETAWLPECQANNPDARHPDSHHDWNLSDGAGRYCHLNVQQSLQQPVRIIFMSVEFFESLQSRDGGLGAIAMLDGGMPVNQFLPGGITPLVAATSFGNSQVVNALLSRGADVNTACRDESRQTALHAAANLGWESIVNALLASGASVRSVNSARATPLHNSAAMGFVSICELLIRNGADSAAKNSFKGTPLLVAVVSGALGDGEYAIREFRREAAQEGVVLPEQARQDYEATVTFLLRQGAGRREISKAAKLAKSYGSEQMLRVLMFHGAR